MLTNKSLHSVLDIQAQTGHMIVILYFNWN